MILLIFKFIFIFLLYFQTLKFDNPLKLFNVIIKNIIGKL